MTSDNEQSRTRGASEDVAGSGGVRTVIVLEGDDDLRASIAELLEDDGYLVLPSGDISAWRSSLALARSSLLDVRFHIVDLAVADAPMVEELCVNGWKQPIIAVAANGSVELDFIDHEGRRSHHEDLPPQRLLAIIAELNGN